MFVDDVQLNEKKPFDIKTCNRNVWSNLNEQIKN